MDSLTVSWFKIACLLLAGFCQLGIIAIAIMWVKQGIIERQAEMDKEEQEEKPKQEAEKKSDGYTNKDLFPKEKTTAFKDYKPGAYFDCEANTYSPLPKPVWVAESRKPKEGDGTSIYFFHLVGRVLKPSGIILGECYLYSKTAKNFVTTTDPQTALLIQQLLNDGNLITNDINNNKSNDLR